MGHLQKNTSWIIGLTLLAIGISFGSWQLYLSKKSYETIAVKKGSVTEAVYGLGTVKTHASYELKLGVSSIVKKFFVQEGEPVKKNDLLVEFDLMDKFRAPIDGIISQVNANISELISPQRSIIRIEDPSQRYLEIILDQKGALRIEKNQKASIVFETLRNEKLQGVVESIYSRDHEFVVHVDVSDLKENILTGMTADVAIEVAQKYNRTLIPLAGIHRGRVIKLEKGKKKVIPVSIDAVDGEWAELVTGNIEEGDLLIISNKEK